MWREGEVLAALEDGPRTVDAVAASAYPEVAPALRSLAGRQALAHLLRLERAGRVRRAGDRFVLAGPSGDAPPARGGLAGGRDRER
jgi:hypothetical protein